MIAFLVGAFFAAAAAFGAFLVAAFLAGAAFFAAPDGFGAFLVAAFLATTFLATVFLAAAFFATFLRTFLTTFFGSIQNDLDECMEDFTEEQGKRVEITLILFPEF